MSDDALTKVCTKCGEEKTLGQFHKQKLGKFGREAVCKECKKHSDAARYAERAVAAGKLTRDGCLSPVDCKARAVNRLCNRCKMHRRFEDPNYRARTSAHIAEVGRRLHADPEWSAANTARATATITRLNSDPAFRERLREQSRQFWLDPENRQKVENGKQEYWEHEMFMRRMEQEAAESVEQFDE